ncbi:hypothetical protein GPECTOR_2g1155 [Gonium pectorale]|uniref:N-acetylgalactosaminide beta-1,3-galactosyltransferase n=1 Tax=Gonium pectorale TaxID=33097 RepID=A0A150H0K4_GONPE|nr:hypothetical protein GPECTOR_2g1155 [Gonium pectorale]|eukprot:KXZ55605.1 hypothetical protein GPECTOR_2g1155 [Gonium pectorale]
MHLAKSTRAWRRGVRGFFLTDQNQTESLLRLNAEGTAHNESYAFFPNDGHPLLGLMRHGTMSGDTRAAVAPFAAHRHFGETYKWLLYGDDDTLFFMDAVKHMLDSYDPDLPLAFSDDLWYYGRHPNPHAPRCLPCNVLNETQPDLETVMRKPYMRPAGAHGGSGMIFSVGLMRRIPLEAALKCFQNFSKAPGGDYMVSHCLWQHNIAFTDPGPLVRHLYDPHYYTFGGGRGLGFLWDPIGMLTHGRCNSTCRWMLRNTLSLHIKGRHFRSWRISTMFMWGIARASEAARSFLDLASSGWRDLPYGEDSPLSSADSVPEIHNLNVTHPTFASKNI